MPRCSTYVALVLAVALSPLPFAPRAGLVPAATRLLFGEFAFAFCGYKLVVKPLLRHPQKLPPFEFTPLSDLGAAAAKDNRWLDTYLTSADGTRLHAVVDDTTARVPGKRAIVFLHGFPEGWLAWKPQLEHSVGLGHSVLALSMRGYGLSDQPSEVAKYHTDHLVEDVEAAINAVTVEGLPSPLLVAHDWGAGVAWEYLHLPNIEAKVAGYVALATPPSEGVIREIEGLKAQLLASMYVPFFNAPVLSELLLGTGHAWFVAALVSHCVSANHTCADERHLAFYRTSFSRPGALTAALNYYRAAVQHSSWQSLRSAAGTRPISCNSQCLCSVARTICTCSKMGS